MYHWCWHIRLWIKNQSKHTLNRNHTWKCCGKRINHTSVQRLLVYQQFNLEKTYSLMYHFFGEFRSRANIFYAPLSNKWNFYCIHITLRKNNPAVKFGRIVQAHKQLLYWKMNMAIFRPRKSWTVCWFTAIMNRTVGRGYIYKQSGYSCTVRSSNPLFYLSARPLQPQRDLPLLICQTFQNHIKSFPSFHRFRDFQWT